MKKHLAPIILKLIDFIKNNMKVQENSNLTRNTLPNVSCSYPNIPIFVHSLQTEPELKKHSFS